MAHRLDLVSHPDGRPIAIEVEPSPKAPRQLSAIVRGSEDAVTTGRRPV
jgi:hypothetical protein